MHQAVYDYVRARTVGEYTNVLEFGSRNVNGSLRDIVRAWRYVGVDIADGPGVDIVADAATVVVPGEFELVLCAEVFEHAPDEQCAGMCANAFRHLAPGGMFIATMAGPRRAEHSAVDGGALRPGEFYRNVDADLLRSWLIAAGFADPSINEYRDDIRCVAVKK
jgi:predicted methyltransferase